MASLSITNATLLSVGHEPERFNSDFRFGTRKNISVEVTELASIKVTDYVGDSANAADALRKTANWSSISINGESLGAGKLTGFQLEEGTWVKFTKATINVQVYEDGDMRSFTGEYYKGLADLKASGKFLDNFSESFDFERSPDSTTFKYSINLQFSAAASLKVGNNGCLSGEVAKAMGLAEGIIRGGAAQRPAFALIDPEVKALFSTYGSPYKRFIRESTDLINNSCTFTEDFKAYNIEGASYSSIIRTNLTLGEDGIVTVKENGKLLGLSSTDADEIRRALPGVDGEINAAIAPAGRLQEMFAYYEDLWDCQPLDPLITVDGGDLLIIRKGRVFDSFRGEATYNITCTNDPDYKDCVRHEYTVTTETVAGQKGGVYRATERGSIIGKTKGESNASGDIDEDGEISWECVKEYWASILGANGFVIGDDGKSRIKDILDTPSPRLVSNSTTKSPWKVTISYDQMVSEAPKFAENDGVAKSITFKQNNNYSVQKHKVGNAINAGKQILQRRETQSRDSQSASVEVVGKRQSSLDDVLGLVKGKLSDPGAWPGGGLPQGTMTFIDGCSYSHKDDNDVKLTFNIGWK